MFRFEVGAASTPLQTNRCWEKCQGKFLKVENGVRFTYKRLICCVADGEGVLYRRVAAVSEPDPVLAGSADYAVSQTRRTRIEQGFWWVKLIGPTRQMMVRGLARLGQVFVRAMTVYNLIRMRTLGKLRLEAW